MTHASNYALRGSGAFPVQAWSDFTGDLVRGAMLTARFVVMLAGCVALIGAAALLGDGDLRARATEQAPALLAIVLPSASQEVPTVEDAATEESAAAELGPAMLDATTGSQQRFIAQYLARRYRVAEDGIRSLVAAAYETGGELNLDPTLILAVMAIESSMNPLAESPVGAQGLMQVMTSVHTDKFEPHGGEQAALDPIANIKVGSAILKDLVRRGGSIERGLQLYVGAGNLPDDGGYGARVLGERTRIMLAATGRVDRAIVAAIRAGARARATAAAQRAAVSAASPAPSAVPTVSEVSDSTSPRPSKALDRAA